MEDQLFQHIGLLFSALAVFVSFLLRYIVIAGGAFVFFYFLRRKKWQRRKVQKKTSPKWKQMRMEIGWSLSTFVIFGLMGLGIRWMYLEGWTQIYSNIDEYGWVYFFVSIFLMIVLHDTWFYWTHRFMHLKKVFPLVHKVHHLSNSPTPWASFSFHPIEAVIEGTIFVLIAVLIPSNVYALLIFLLIMTIANVDGHLGFELFPKGFSKTIFIYISNTTTHHDMHHRLVKYNFGLYFNVWDRLMGTNHPQYEEMFDKVHREAEEATVQEKDVAAPVKTVEA